MMIKKNKKVICFNSKIFKAYGVTDKQGGMLHYSPSLAEKDRYEELSDSTNSVGYRTNMRKFKAGNDLADA